MKLACLLALALLPCLGSASKLKPAYRESYADYAKKSGISVDKSRADYQYADCYDYFGSQGSYYHAQDYISNLQSYGWDNRFSSCCYYGIWTLYADSDFNGRNPNAAAWSGWGERFCEDLQGNPTFDNQASSIRYAGAPDGYKYDTINLYQYGFYAGLEQYSYGDANQLQYDNLGKSAIVTGCSAWTVYEYNNYQGRCACLYPSDTSNCYPGFYKDLGSVANQISSVRRGCFCNKKLAPDAQGASYKSAGSIGGSQSFAGN